MGRLIIINQSNGDSYYHVSIRHYSNGITCDELASFMGWAVDTNRVVLTNSRKMMYKGLDIPTGRVFCLISDITISRLVSANILVSINHDVYGDQDDESLDSDYYEDLPDLEKQ